jgi:hypothetical protein
MNAKVWAFFFGWIILQSCTHHPSSPQESDGVAWKEMDAFHDVLAECYHPYRDSGNLVPAFDHAKELSDLAAAWGSAELPAKLKAPEVKALLAQLSAAAARLPGLAAAKDTAQLGEQLNAVHEHFHRLQEQWNGEEMHHEDHH